MYFERYVYNDDNENIETKVIEVRFAIIEMFRSELSRYTRKNRFSSSKIKKSLPQKVKSHRK